MSERVTDSRLQDVVLHYQRLLTKFELLEGSLYLRRGSKTYGNQYKLTMGGCDEYIAAPGTRDGNLGMTKREAIETLYTMCRVLEDLALKNEQL